MGTLTLLFVDQVASTRQLVALGDARAAWVRKALLDLLTESIGLAQGRIVDTAGDGVFAAFDSAAAGLDAATSMVQLAAELNHRLPEVERIELRVGLHAGEPVAQADGSLFGTSVVAARRLCERAQPGELVLSDLVVQLAGANALPRTALGRVELKGIPEPVEAALVIASPPVAARSALGAPPWPIVGRDAELRAALDAGGALVVEGPDGIGVSAVVAELGRRAEADGWTVRSASAPGAAVPFGWWAELLAQHVDLSPTALLRIELGREGGELVRLVPELVDKVRGLPPPSAAEGGVETYLIADAIEALLLRMRRTRPVAILLDDAQRADASSIQVLERMLRRGRVDDIRFVIGHHPALGPDPVGPLRPHLGAVRLGPLDEPGTGALVEALVGHRDEALERAVFAESLGHPFFAAEIVRSRRSAQIEQRLGGLAVEADDRRRQLRRLTGEIADGLRELELIATSGAVVASEGHLDPDGTPPVPMAAPYLGPLPYGPGDAERFAGRTELVAELVARLASTPCLVVVGPSGSGKTSVVFGGLLPALERSPVRPVERVTTVRPGPNPFASLRSEAAIGSTTDDDVLVSTLVGDGRGLLVVDQLEELFTSDLAEADQIRYLGVLAAVTERMPVVAVIRSDFVDRLARHPEFGRRAEEGMVLVGPIGPDELREVVLRPAATVGLLVDPELVELVVADAADQRGALPHVSTALLAAFERRRGRSMTAAAYREAGGVAGALAALADATFGSLGDDEQLAARRLFGRLAHAGPSGDDLRRTVPFDELSSEPATRSVVDRFVDRRLLVRTALGVEVAHEALLRDWPLAREWLASDREERRTHQQLTAAVQEWERAGRDPELLWRAGRATVAAEWLAAHGDWVNEAERSFVEASAEAAGAELVRARRLNRRLRSLVGVVAVLLVVALVAAGLALRSRRAAQQRATVETAERLAAQATESAQRDAPLALLLGLEGHDTTANPATTGGLLSAFAGVGHLRSVVADGAADVLPAASVDTSVVAVPLGGGGVEVRSGDAPPRRLDPVGGRPVVGLALDERGELLAVAGANGVLELWSVDDGAQVATGELPGATSAFLLFSPTGKRVAAATPDGAVRVFDSPTLEGGDAVVEFPSRAVVAFGDDDHLVASGGFVPGVVVDLVAGTTVSFGPEFQGPSAAVFSGDGRDILATDTFGVLLRYSAETGVLLGELTKSIQETPTDLALAPDGSMLAAGLTSGDVLVVDPADGTVIERFRTASAVNDVWVTRDGLVVSRSPGRLSVWDLDQLHPLVDRSTLPGDSAVFMSQIVDARMIVVDTGTGTVERWDAATRRPDGTRYEAARAAPFAASISPDGASVVVSSTDDLNTGANPLLQRFDAETGQPLASIEMDAPTYSIGHDPTGRLLATFDDPDRLVIRDAATLEPIRSVGGLGPTWNLDWSADGSAVYVAGGDLFRVDAGTGEVTTVVGGPGDVYSVDALPDGRVLAGSGSQLVVVGADGDTAGSLNLVDIAIDVSASVQLGIVAVVTHKGGVRLVDLDGIGALGSAVPVSTAGGRNIRFDGTTLLGTGDDGTVFRMSVDVDSWADAACRLAGRNLTSVEARQFLGRSEAATCAQWPETAAE